MKSHLALLRIPAFNLGGALLCILLIALPPQLLAQQPGSNRTLKEIARPFYAAAEFELSKIDAADFDFEALQKIIGTKPAEIAKWIRNETRWVPYVGALKGAAGTLLARQGNLLDRNLLLAGMIEASGREVRIVHFKTDVKQKQMLLEMAAQQNSGGQAGYEKSVLQPNQLDELRKSTGLNQEEASEVIEKQTNLDKRFANALTDTLDEHRSALTKLIQDKISLDPDDDSWSGTLDQYFYVQHRPSENDPWQSTHLISPEPTTNGELLTFNPNEIPKEWLHRVEINVIAVQIRGDKEKELTALTHSITTDDLSVVPLRIQFAPTNITDVVPIIKEVQQSKSIEPLTKRMTATHAWVPVIRIEGAKPMAGSAIDHIGRLTPVDKIGIAEQNKDQLSRAFDILNKQLSTGQPSGPKSVLKEVRIDFHFHVPGQDVSRSVKRPVYIRTEAADAELNNEQLLKRSLTLSTQASMLLTSGHLSHDYATQRRANTKLGLRLATNYISANDHNDWREKLDPAIALKVVGKFDLFPTKLYGIAAARSSPRTYLPQPNLIANWEKISISNNENISFSTTIDFIENRMGTVASSSTAKFQDLLKSGLRDSIIETETSKNVATATSASRFFEQDGRKGWQIVEESNSSLLKSLNIPQAAKDGIQDDLDRGYLIALRPEIDNGICAWWRIDPHSGECLGMMGSDNWIGGASITTTEVLLIAIAMTSFAILVLIVKWVEGAEQRAYDKLVEEFENSI